MTLLFLLLCLGPIGSAFSFEDCSFKEENQGEASGSGGHSHRFYVSASGQFAKKVSLEDWQKIKTVYDHCDETDFGRRFCGFLPKIYGVCQWKDELFLQMENLKGRFDHPLEVDIKLGHLTLHQKNLEGRSLAGKANKILTHGIFDLLLSPSWRKGYRMCGENFIAGKRGKKKRIKIALHTQPFLKQFLQIIHPEGKKCIEDKLQAFKQLTHENGFSNLQFVGSSLLLIGEKDSAHCEVKLIDFDHFMEIAEENIYTRGFKEGVENLLKDIMKAK